MTREHPVVVLVEPQLAQNIGMAARAMANFGLTELRLVAPRDGWPNADALSPAAGATHILDGARVFPDLRAAIGDLHYVLATTARGRDQMKRVLPPDEALAGAARRVAAGQGVGILFGRERTGLQNDDVSFADAILTFPIDPALASLNLAQAVLLVGYEWSRAVRPIGAALPFDGGPRTPAPPREAVAALFDRLEGELDAAGHYPPGKREIMSRNMRDMFHRMELTEQDVRTWHGAIRALTQVRRSGKA